MTEKDQWRHQSVTIITYFFIVYDHFKQSLFTYFFLQLKKIIIIGKQLVINREPEIKTQEILKKRSNGATNSEKLVMISDAKLETRKHAVTCVPDCELQLFPPDGNHFYLKVHTYKRSNRELEFQVIRERSNALASWSTPFSLGEKSFHKI